MAARISLAVLFGLILACPGLADEITVEKDARRVIIPAKIAPRKLPHLDQIYPIEVIATYSTEKKGAKAHETVVTFDVKPSDVHKALESLGLKPGTPAMGEGAQASGPEVKVFLELPGEGGQAKKIPIERALADRKTGLPMPTLKWHFTGSVMKQLDPDKPDKAYAADHSGTLIGIFPVTNETVIQTNLTMKDEPLLKLETNKKVLPPEGTAVKLIIEAK